MKKPRTFNLCKNWTLKCLEQQSNAEETIVRLSCILNGQKKSNGAYIKGLPVQVICRIGECQIVEMNYEGKYISVCGGITVSEYTASDNTPKSILTLFADSVTLHKWDKS